MMGLGVVALLAYLPTLYYVFVIMRKEDYPDKQPKRVTEKVNQEDE